MKLDEIKQEALTFRSQNMEELTDKMKELKGKGVPFTGLVFFMQHHQQISLSEARKQTTDLEIWTEKEKNDIREAYELMMSDSKEENED